MIKRILLAVCVIFDVFLLVSVIGYIKWGLDMPTILAGKEMHFMGAYILALIYGVAFVIVTTIVLVLVIKEIRNGRQN